MEKLAIVVPCYNEEEVLKIASEALRGVLDDLIRKGKIAEDSFILFVNDGSKDNTKSEIIRGADRRRTSGASGTGMRRETGRQCGTSVRTDRRTDHGDGSVRCDGFHRCGSAG